MHQELKVKGQAAKKAARIMGSCGSIVKDAALCAMADALVAKSDEILLANTLDVTAAKKKGTGGALLDRLTLTAARIEGMAEGIRQIASLPDPVGEVISMWTRPNGLQIGQKRVPLGVIGIIYEARPNVTADAAALCIKASNAVILRGGSEAIFSNQKIVQVMNEALIAAGLPSGVLQLIEDTSRETAVELMRLNEYVDVLIPRGGAGLIQTVVQNSTVPVIETGTGICHTYVDSGADLDMALSIAVNAKTSRPAVCNAMETLLVAKSEALAFLPMLQQAMAGKVELRCCEQAIGYIPGAVPATQEDWGTEYLDYILSVKVVEDIEEAMEHIDRYGTRHSEAIITKDYKRGREFLEKVDAAAVYINASTRFTDGYEFGFGAEIGISTQKIHSRGPMGLAALTTIKYIIFGDGQIR